MPNTTGTRMTGSCRDMAPRRRACPTLLLGYLLATGSYKFWVLNVVLGGVLATLSLLRARGNGRRQERGGHVRQFGFFFGAQRLHKVRGDHHQQFIRGF